LKKKEAVTTLQRNLRYFFQARKIANLENAIKRLEDRMGGIEAVLPLLAPAPASEAVPDVAEDDNPSRSLTA
jgi:hypothetical protein